MSAIDRGAMPALAARAEFARDLQRCLGRSPHAISPKYFYDGAGSRLFEDICELPEYYVTRTELGILRRHADEMAELAGPQAEVVEFGAGSLLKARLLIDALAQPRRFVAIDISGEHLTAACTELRNEFPGLDVEAVVADFTEPAALPLTWSGGRRVGFFPGSTIGNFTPSLAARFLAEAARLLRGGGLLIGVDLVKDPARLHAAYNDAAGVTAAFNRNLLVRANSELDCNFRVDAFRHYAFYNPQRQRVEMHLVNTVAQQVSLDGRSFLLADGASIHTENSHKYTIAGLRHLARHCGFRPTACWCDEERLFSLHWLESAVP